MVDRIVIVTGSKGGGGKTPLALSLILSYESLGYNVIAVDLNFNNADLFAILQGTNLEERAQKGNSQVKEELDLPYWQISDKIRLVSWDYTKTLGLPNTEELWNFLSKISSSLSQDLTGKTVIIADSNLTLPLLCPPLQKLQAWDLDPLEVWHIWSPSVVLNLSEQERFTTAMDVLKRFSSGFEDRLHHVFTPRFHMSENFLGNLSMWARGEKRLVKQKRSYGGSQPKPIQFNEIKDALFANYLVELLNWKQDETSTEWLMKTWLENIVSSLEQREVPASNVIVIPSMIAKIALFVEELALKPNKTIDSLKNDLGPIYEIVAQNVQLNLLETK